MDRQRVSKFSGRLWYVGVKRQASVHSSGICSSGNHGDSKWHPPGMRLSFCLAVDNDVLPRVDDVILGGLMSYCGRLRHWSTETSVKTSIFISNTHTHTAWRKPAQMHHLCKNWFCKKISKNIKVPSFSLPRETNNQRACSMHTNCHESSCWHDRS